MFIVNSNKSNMFKCGEIVYSYLKRQVPLLSRDEKYYYFANTEALKDALEKAPIHIKIMRGVGWI
jgi:hypothetical protein